MRIEKRGDGGDPDTVAMFEYDALGRRIEKIDSIAATTTQYYYEGLRVLCETDENGDVQRRYTYGNYLDETLILTDTTGASDVDYYYAHNHLFSPVALMEDDGDVVERYEYDAYGKPTIYNYDFSQTYDTTQYDNPYLFTGRRVDNFDSDSLRLQYNRNRYYDYDTGRWLSHDPLEYIDSMNLYIYVLSNPAKNLDPMGLASVRIRNPRPYVTPDDFEPCHVCSQHSTSYQDLLTAQEVFIEKEAYCRRQRCEGKSHRCAVALLDMIGAAISQARSEVKNEMNKGDFPIEELWDMVGSDLKKFASGTEHNPKIMAWTVMYLQGRGDVPQWVVDQYNLAYLFSDTFHETLDKIIKRYGDVDSAIRVLQALSQAQRTRSYSDTILVFSEILSAGSGYAPPGFREMLEYYAEATDAIAGKIEDIELQLGENTLNEIQILKCNEIRYGSSLMSGGKFSYRWAESILEEYMESVGRKGEKNSKVKEFEKACR